VTAYDLVCRRLHEVTGYAGRNGSWRCPAHDDRNPSLSVKAANDGTVLLHCHAGCHSADILAALALDVRDLFDTPKKNDIVAVYDYVDEGGALLFQVVRKADKRFVQRRPDGAGAWVWKLGDTRRVLYRLPEVIAAVAAGTMVFVVEGEKDADRLAAAGYVATTNPHGAGKWRATYNASLAGADVTIIADRDEPGRAHARAVADQLTGIAAHVWIVEPTKGKDASDHLAAGLDVGDMTVEYDSATEPPGGRMVSYDEAYGDTPTPSATKKTVAVLLVEIAEELYDFGCVSEQRGHVAGNPGDDPVAVFTYASPKGNPDIKRPLADIRPDIAAVYEATYGTVPTKTALGDAMMVLQGKARRQAPSEATPTLLSILGGGSVATQLVEMAHEHYTLGVTETGEVYAVAKDGPNIARRLRGGRRSLRADLARAYFEKHKTAAGAQALADALLVLEGEAQGLDPTVVHLRCGRALDGRLVLDLCRDDGLVALIDGSRWELTDSPVVLWRTNASLPLPTPDPAGNLDRLRVLLNVRDEDWPLIVAWLVAALIPDVPHAVLLLKGEHGTAKSTAARLLTSLLDRAASQLRTAPRDVEDWAVACAGSWVTCLDNVSHLQSWLQDAICRAVTGDRLLRRQLYTDSDVAVLAYKRVLALTSIDPGSLNGDLADRLLTVELERIAEADRLSEERLANVWGAAHPQVLGGLLNLTVDVLAALPQVRSAGLPRMADFARVMLAVDEVLGTSAYETYAEQAGSTAEQVADADSVSVAIRRSITTTVTGTASALLERLTPDKPPRDWPTTPQAMGGRLSRAAPALRRLGWLVEPPVRTVRVREWTIAPPHAEEYPAEMA
jgi:hypothetical protein